MNARTSVLTAAAILVLAVPAAAGARAVTTFRVAKETTAAHEIGQSLAGHKSRTAKTGHASKKTAGKSSKESIRPVIYINVPGPATPPSAVVDPNECQDSGNNCTDQQACQYWGMNCDAIGSSTVQAPSQPAAPAAVTTTNTTPTTTPTPAADGYDASNCWDYTDYQATLDPAYC